MYVDVISKALACSHPSGVEHKHALMLSFPRPLSAMGSPSALGDASCGLKWCVVRVWAWSADIAALLTASLMSAASL